MNAEERAADIHGAGAERIIGATLHVVGNEVALLRLALDHDVRRAPLGPLPLHDNPRMAAPAEAVAADAYLVTQRRAARQHIIECPLRRADDDRARLVLGVVEADGGARNVIRHAAAEVRPEI